MGTNETFRVLTILLTLKKRQVQNLLCDMSYINSIMKNHFYITGFVRLKTEAIIYVSRR